VARAEISGLRIKKQRNVFIPINGIRLDQKPDPVFANTPDS